MNRNQTLLLELIKKSNGVVSEEELVDFYVSNVMGGDFCVTSRYAFMDRNGFYKESIYTYEQDYGYIKQKAKSFYYRALGRFIESGEIGIVVR
jgi:hypothetical protein